MDQERETLHELCVYFSDQMRTPVSHIQTVEMSGIEQIKRLVELAKEQKIALKGVWSPTVPLGQERLRISLHSYNTRQEIDVLLQLISKN
jgi:8-amino-7-oxononanoate synthase